MSHPHLTMPAGKPRARSLGLNYPGTPGPFNAITDVPGVEVGYQTLIEGDNVRTGVTAIHPRGKDDPDDSVAAGFHSHNGNGEMTGISWIEESGTFQGPIAITNTHAVGVAHAGIIAWLTKQRHTTQDVWHLPVAAETWDGYLNDIHGHHVTEDIVVRALDAAAPGPVDEGSVGGGTGMTCYQFKAGSGTASRVVAYAGTDYTVGVFVQANFGRRQELTLNHLYLGDELKDDNPMSERALQTPQPPPGTPQPPPGTPQPPPGTPQPPPGMPQPPPGAGSVIAIVATDAPLFPSQCKAMARRVTMGIARTGAVGSHFSGDLFLAFSTANPGAFTQTDPASRAAAQASARYDTLTFIPWGFLDPFYEAVVQATEEAVANSLTANDDMTGVNGHRVPALPRERLKALIARTLPVR